MRFDRQVLRTQDKKELKRLLEDYHVNSRKLREVMRIKGIKPTLNAQIEFVLKVLVG